MTSNVQIEAIALNRILPRPESVSRALIAGWAGRDLLAVGEHVKELAELGVAPPSETPLFYEVSRDRITDGVEIQDVGPGGGGEVECVLWRIGGALYLGLGSDHTDRELEATSVAMSKQVCDKPVSDQVIRLSDLDCSTDDLRMSCRIRENGEWVLYQEGSLDTLWAPLELLSLAQKRGALTNGEDVALFCGTLPAIGGVRPANEYRMALYHPDGRELISLGYDVRRLKANA
ncbi:DUF2848 family protein [Roseibium sp. SCP14]|uniref:DUF2848 family protein n=1 Tax=Roseibium sp. SCP14 TaxID=3141375 RepID=UPI003336FB19